MWDFFHGKIISHKSIWTVIGLLLAEPQLFSSSRKRVNRRPYCLWQIKYLLLAGLATPALLHADMRNYSYCVVAVTQHLPGTAPFWPV